LVGSFIGKIGMHMHTFVVGCQMPHIVPGFFARTLLPGFFAARLWFPHFLFVSSPPAVMST
jgi:hypothetical protein